MLESENSDLEKGITELENILINNKKVENKINIQNKIIFKILLFLLIISILFFLLYYFKQINL